MALPSPRTVTVRRVAGLGDLLLSTCATWLYAQATGRTLVIDWRGTHYTARTGRNLFSTLFEPMDTWCGVPVHIADAHDERFRPDLATVNDEVGAGLRSCALVNSGADVEEQHVRWWGCVAPAHRAAQTRELLRALRPLPLLAEAVDAARGELLGDGASIGVHLRHGNGGNILGHAPYWADGLAVHRVLASVRRARHVLGDDTPVLVCTDSSEVLTAMRALLPGVRALDKRFRSAGEGELHLWSEAATAVDQTFVEMLLLAHTSVLVRMPPESYFSTPAALTKEPAPAELLVRSPTGLDPAVW